MYALMFSCCSHIFVSVHTYLYLLKALPTVLLYRHEREQVSLLLYIYFIHMFIHLILID
jgi:tryptophan-rich sensory protein